jgi:hypothetical protein
MTAEEALARFDTDCATQRKAFEGAGLERLMRKHRIDEMFDAMGSDSGSIADPEALSEKICLLVSGALTNREVWVSRLINTLAAILVPLVWLREKQSQAITPARIKECVREWIVTGTVPEWARQAPHGDVLAITEAIDARCTRDRLEGEGARIAVRYATLFTLAFVLEALILAEQVRPAVNDRHTEDIAQTIARGHQPL